MNVPPAEYQEHMRKLSHAFFKNLQRDHCEYGGIGLDSKRPFGNSSVQADILEIVGIEPPSSEGFTIEQECYADDLYSGLIEWLQDEYIEHKTIHLPK